MEVTSAEGEIAGAVRRLPAPGPAEVIRLLRRAPVPAVPGSVPASVSSVPSVPAEGDGGGDEGGDGDRVGEVRPVIGRPPGARLGVLARYPCPHGCGWHHAERPDLGPPLRITLPARPTSGDVGRAISGHARQVAAERHARVRAAISGHLGDGCPAAPS